MKWLYNFVLVLAVFLYLPKCFFQRKYRTTWRLKLGLELPTFHKAKQRIWVHATSMGEVHAALPFIKKLQEKEPDWDLVVSTTTETGLKEARRILPGVSSFFLLPLDFSWVMNRLISRINPHVLVLVEGDLWYNLIQASPKTVLINGKISEKSRNRFQKFPFFTKALFQKISLFCVQNKLYQERFLSLGVAADKIVITGNLKLDVSKSLPNLEEVKMNWGLKPTDRVITLGSTHEGEEVPLLKEIQPLFSLFPSLKVLLVPRHPARFKAVAQLLKTENLPFIPLSEIEKREGMEKILLIDTMGQLNTCYALSEIAIVAGSFTSKVGGHNIFEPVFLGTPVLFGPWMFTQEELAKLVLEAKAGQQITTKEVFKTVKSWLENPPQEMKQACLSLAHEVRGSANRTWEPFFPYLS